MKPVNNCSCSNGNAKTNIRDTERGKQKGRHVNSCMLPYMLSIQNIKWFCTFHYFRIITEDSSTFACLSKDLDFPSPLGTVDAVYTSKFSLMDYLEDK